jgi:hypothetical protein
MQRLEVSSVVRHIYDIRRQRVNNINVQSASDGGSGDDRVLPKIANAGFVDAVSKKSDQKLQALLCLTI